MSKKKNKNKNLEEKVNTPENLENNKEKDIKEAEIIEENKVEEILEDNKKQKNEEAQEEKSKDIENKEKENVEKNYDKKEDEIEENEEDDDEDDEDNLEQSEVYKNASFKEKLSLKFRKRLIRNGVHTLVLIVILLFAFFGVNRWAEKQNLARIDVTKEKLYSLTEVSKKELSNLQKDVNIYIYGLEENNNYTTFVKQYSAFNKHIKNEIVTESTNYDIVSEYSLSNYQEGAIVVVCGEKSKVLNPSYDFYEYDQTGGTSDIAEQAITNAILNVSTDNPIKVYFTAGNGENSINELTGLKYALEEKVYECNSLSLVTVTEIPEDCDILAIVGLKKDFSEDETNVIKAYINKGGNIFFAMTKQDENEKFDNLQSILDLYGVSINYGMLYEANSGNSLAYGNTVYQNILIPNPTYSSEISSNMANYVIIPWAQSLEINSIEEENVTVTNAPIITSSNNCYNITDLNSSEFDLSKLDKKQYTIGAEFTRTVTTKNEEGKEESSITSKLVAYANNSFLTDYYSFDQLTLTPIGYYGNFELAQNSFAHLAEQENLITARKQNNSSTFQVSSKQDRIVKLVIFGIPVIIIVFGIIVWTIRKRKR